MMSLRKLAGLSAILVTVCVSAGVEGGILVTDLDAPARALNTGTDGLDQRLVGLWIGGRSIADKELRYGRLQNRKGRAQCRESSC